jgi:acetoacetyl-CoA synthetase
MGAFLDWAERAHGIRLPTYHDAWAWSVRDPAAFWESVARFFDVPFHSPWRSVLTGEPMPDARWFEGATLNYAELALGAGGGATAGVRAPEPGTMHASGSDGSPAVIARSQTRGRITLTRRELSEQVARAATGLRRLGVGPGDRVVGYLPNVPEALVAFLACASLGAVWSSCAPEMGARSVIDRTGQIEPKVLIATDGYRYGERVVARGAEVAAIQAALPTLEATVVLAHLDPDVPPDTWLPGIGAPAVLTWDELTGEESTLAFEPVPFDYPLYVLYTSGTTGLPKAIVHGHGGIVLEHLKLLALHHDLGPKDRFLWFTTTGWMMWNYLVSGLLVGSTVVLFDGDPGWPDPAALWAIAAEERVTVLGVGAPYLLRCRRLGLSPGARLDLTALRSVCSTGSPLPAEGFAWLRDHVRGDVHVGSLSGGTDVCTAFVGPCPLLPVHAGEIQCRCLGANVEALDERGEPMIGRRGELALTAPMPSMPVGLWNDPERTQYRKAYFGHPGFPPGVWRHGDWIEITDHGSCIISGRSDATLKRGGVRIGTAEIYAVVDALPGISDSLVVHDERGHDGAGEVVLFVVPAAGSPLDEAMETAIRGALRSQLSPRHVPDAIVRVPAVPRTISGKKMELPVKRLLAGERLEAVAQPGAMANPESLGAFVRFASRRMPAPGHDGSKG